MQPTRASWLFALALCLPAFAQTDLQIRFDKSRYDISPGETFPVRILIDPVPSPGLFSFGTKMVFNGVNAVVSDVAAIAASPVLDFNGVRGQGAVKQVGAGFAAVRGTVDVAATPI